jgi:hypothetical protein
VLKNTNPEKSIDLEVKTKRLNRAYASKSVYVTKLVPTQCEGAKSKRMYVLKDKGSSKYPKGYIGALKD